MRHRRPKLYDQHFRARFWALALFMWLAVGASAVHSLPDDREQPIRITADQAVRDEKQGFTVYSGNVQMDQGSLHIDADKITIYHSDEDADRVVAEGTPARMQQQPEPDDGLVKAQATKIEYFKMEDRALLTQNAQIQQDGSTVTGETIEYFISEQLVRADSNQDAADSRVEVVIPAQNIPENKDDRGDTDSE
ncbi:MAG: lipopolysaccharide transport periplasmic protein LptA [Halioglobus sp.]